MKTNIIAFSGPINSGKSTTANMTQYCLNMPKCMRQYWIYKLLGKHTIFKKWKQRSFAYPLKKMLASLLNVKLEKFEDRSFKESMISFNKDSEPINDNQFNKAIKRDDIELLSNSSLTIRQLMQWFGSTIMPKYFGENVWVNATLKSCVNHPTIISDVRFKKEATAIHQYNGKIVLIERANNSFKSNHISEKEWIKMKHTGVYDYTINNEGSQKDLFNEVTKMLKVWNL